MDAIIFAAGHGTRMRPLTDTLPKPLIEINGMSLIEAHLYRLAAAGFDRVIINLHHLGEMISNQLGNGARYGLHIVYSEEHGEALETAGGIVKALPLINSQQFIVISGDVLCNYSLERLTHPLRDSHGFLVMVANPAHHTQGDFSLSDSGHLVESSRAVGRQSFTYSGLASFDRTLFESIAEGKRALRPILESGIAKQQLRGEVHTGIWSDIGTPQRLGQARASSEVATYIDSIKQSIS